MTQQDQDRSTTTGTDDEYVKILEAWRHYPNRPHRNTPVRHSLDGVMVPGIGRVYLQTIRIGGSRLTTVRWINEFFAACSARPGDSGSTEAPAGEAERRSRQAGSALESIGA
jgi:hypothetical protein